MNAIDGTETASVNTSDAPPASLLSIIIDTNPYAWSLLSSILPLSKAIANLLVFVNAHLAINHANQVAVIASHTQRAVWLYPTPNPPASSSSSSSSSSANGSTNGSASPPEDANKYRPFAVIEAALLTNLQHLLATTPPSTLEHTTTTQTAGALTTALSYISKQTLLSNPVPSSTYLSSSDTPSGLPAADNNDGTPGTRRATLTARILMLSVSGDLATQYIPVMNAIFAAQRAGVAIDVLKLAGDTVFLQQACDATGGVYLRPEQPQGLLQYLMMAFLPDATARRALVMPGAGGEVDFRAACFCHRKIVDVGFVCSVCLSIFCEPMSDGVCLTCGTRLSLSSAFSATPAVVPRRKKKKKRVAGESTPSAAGTPAPA